MAVTITAAEVAVLVGVDTGAAARLLAVAGVAIAQYLRGGAVPQATENEAAVLFVGYLSAAEGSGAGAIQTVDVGPVSSRLITDHSAAFRRCGAAGMLAGYRVRRAGKI